MIKTWLIVKHEYTRHVFRWRFFMALVSLPLLFLMAFIIIFVGFVSKDNRAPVGYVDQAKLIQANTLPKEALTIFDYRFLPFPDEAAARDALMKKQIQAYYVLPMDYKSTFKVRLVYLKARNILVENQFRKLLVFNLLAGQPEPVIQRVMEGPHLIVQAIAEKEKDKPQQSSNQAIRFIIPIAASYMLLGALMSTAGYLTQSVVEEKENRTMEIMITSASPSVIMTAKIIALVAVGLTQLLAWFGLPLLMLLAAAPSVPFLQGTMQWNTLLLISLTVFATFLLASTILAMAGATLTEPSEGQQVASFIALPLMIPYFFVNVIMAAPSGPIALFLTFFPITASTTLLFRLAFSTVPIWQILVSTAVVLLTTAGAFWLAGRVFRLGMLRYGKRIHWKEILHTISPFGSKKAAARDA